jgi:hypothetical protein
MKNMETPTIFLYQSTKFQLEKPRLEKKDGEDICAQGRLARVEHEVAELRQLFMSSRNQVEIESSPHHDNSSVKLFAYI